MNGERRDCPALALEEAESVFFLPVSRRLLMNLILFYFTLLFILLFILQALPPAPAVWFYSIQTCVSSRFGTL